METAKCRCGKPADRKLSLEPEIGFFYFCSAECRDSASDEIKYCAEYSMEEENNKYRQGKSRENHETSIKTVGAVIVIGFIISVISYIITLIIKA